MSYVYIKTESELFTVGFYDPTGKFQPESDHGTDIEAAERARWLNGGRDIIISPQLDQCVPYIVTRVHDEFTVQKVWEPFDDYMPPEGCTLIKADKLALPIVLQTADGKWWISDPLPAPVRA